MPRDDIKSKPETGGFIEFGKEQLPKVNTQRRDLSQPNFYGVPILTDQEAMYCTASEIGDKPASCYTCDMQQPDLTCHLLGPSIPVKKFIGSRESGNPIEYFPCCGMHNYGSPQTGKPSYSEHLSTPDTVGLVWINAPEVGQKFGGANCGGGNGGDDCDFYRTHGKKEKWDTESGYCIVLQHEVENGAVCSAWRDDDELTHNEARQLMSGETLETLNKRKLARSIIGRDDGGKKS